MDCLTQMTLCSYSNGGLLRFDQGEIKQVNWQLQMGPYLAVNLTLMPIDADF